MPAERRVECKGKVKSEEAGWWQQPPVIRSCAKRDNDDKTVELMVLMSTSHVAPHISGYILSVIIYLLQVLGQKVACCALQGAESGRQASPRMLPRNAMLVPPSPPPPSPRPAHRQQRTGKA